MFGNSRFVALAGIALIFSAETFAQGCVAVRYMSCANAPDARMGGLSAMSPWQLSLGYRYFHSFRHFRGDHEETNRVEEGTEVINDNNAFDLGLTYAATDRLGLSLTLPYSFNYRSSLYEHYGNSMSANPDRRRFSTEASGLGDIRLSANAWVLDPRKNHRGNFTLGLGVKLPTGEAGITDNFHKRTASGADSVIRRPVDQSIQPGDGGWGFSFETQGFLNVYTRTSLYYNGFYLFNPRTRNNVLRSGSVSSSANGALTDYMSVPDQFLGRLGANVDLPRGFTAGLGGRLEGIPAYDAIGGNSGFRRPGYILSVEPGLSWQLRNWNLYASVPVALVRNRIKSYADDRTGGHGDAAFADYLVNLGMTCHFSTSASAPTPRGGIGIQ